MFEWNCPWGLFCLGDFQLVSPLCVLVLGVIPQV